MKETRSIKIGYQPLGSMEFIVFIIPEGYHRWREDNSIPLTSAVICERIIIPDADPSNRYIIYFSSHPGHLYTATDMLLDDAFGTKNREEIIKVILKNGIVEEGMAEIE